MYMIVVTSLEVFNVGSAQGGVGQMWSGLLALREDNEGVKTGLLETGEAEGVSVTGTMEGCVSYYCLPGLVISLITHYRTQSVSSARTGLNRAFSQTMVAYLRGVGHVDYTPQSISGDVLESTCENYVSVATHRAKTRADVQSREEMQASKVGQVQGMLQCRVEGEL